MMNNFKKLKLKSFCNLLIVIFVYLWFQRINKTGTVQEGATDLANEELKKPPSPAKNPLSASGRKNFITDRPHTTSSKQRFVKFFLGVFMKNCDSGWFETN